MPFNTDLKCKPTSDFSCNDCRMNAFCLPVALNSSEVGQLDDIISRDKPLQKNDCVYSAGQAFTSVYAVRSGCIKSYTTNSRGEEQVTGFHLPGEIFGMDGISSKVHTNFAVALQTSAVCEIPFSHLTKLTGVLPALQNHFFRLMSNEIVSDQQMITLLSKNSAEERLATFLLSLSVRNQRQKFSGTHFNLPMSRSDIGNYLGLTVETVSRVFSRLQKLGVLRVDKKEIEILDIDQLHELSTTTD